jgi:hypothetical protein
MDPDLVRQQKKEELESTAMAALTGISLRQHLDRILNVDAVPGVAPETYNRKANAEKRKSFLARAKKYFRSRFGLAFFS